MIPDWNCNTVYFSGLLPRRLPRLWTELTGHFRDVNVEVRLLDGTRDIWARDYCPIQVSRATLVKFQYSPNYLRDDVQLQTGPEICGQLAELGDIEDSPIVADGGNIVADSSRVVMTERVLKENRQYKPDNLCAKLKSIFDVEEVILIPEEKDDLFGHSDGMIRFVEEGHVVVNDYRKVDPRLGRKLRDSLDRQGLQVDVLPYSPEDRELNGVPWAVGNYVNFLRVGDLILLPSYGRKEDTQAQRALEKAIPGTNIRPIHCAQLARKGGGVLSCISWTIQV